MGRAPAVCYAGPVRRVRFLSRPNRYLARVRSIQGGPSFLAHVPNPGRMEELLLPGDTVGYVVPCTRTGRRTRFDLVSVRHGRTLVSIDSRVGNRLVAQALALGRLSAVGPGPWVPEVRWADGRFDFARLHGQDGPLRELLEVKCSNLRVGRTALFPDAPTVRGRRHLLTLARAARRGISGTVVFVIQRPDVEAFAPNGALDPDFARALERARRAGVRLLAWTCRVRPGRVEWGKEVPVAAGKFPRRARNLFRRAPSSRSG